MTTDEMDKGFKAAHEAGLFLKFEGVAEKMSQRPDLHAFLLLDKLVPGNSDIVSAAEHDEIWLATDIEALAAVVSHEQIAELVRCGIRYDTSYESLCSFV